MFLDDLPGKLRQAAVRGRAKMDTSQAFDAKTTQAGMHKPPYSGIRSSRPYVPTAA